MCENKVRWCARKKCTIYQLLQIKNNLNKTLLFFQLSEFCTLFWIPMDFEVTQRWEVKCSSEKNFERSTWKIDARACMYKNDMSPKTSFQDINLVSNTWIKLPVFHNFMLYRNSFTYKMTRNKSTKFVHIVWGCVTKYQNIAVIKSIRKSFIKLCEIFHDFFLYFNEKFSFICESSILMHMKSESKIHYCLNEWIIHMIFDLSQKL